MKELHEFVAATLIHSTAGKIDPQIDKGIGSIQPSEPFDPHNHILSCMPQLCHAGLCSHTLLSSCSLGSYIVISARASTIMKHLRTGVSVTYPPLTLCSHGRQCAVARGSTPRFGNNSEPSPDYRRSSNIFLVVFVSLLSSVNRSVMWFSRWLILAKVDAKESEVAVTCDLFKAQGRTLFWWRDGLA